MARISAAIKIIIASFVVVVIAGCSNGKKDTSYTEVKYDSDFVQSIYLPSTVVYDVQNRFSSTTDLTSYAGNTIDAVKFYINEAPFSLVLKIYNSGTATTPGSLLYTQLVDNVISKSWNTIVLDKPVTITPGKDLWAGFAINSTSLTSPVMGTDYGATGLAARTDGSFFSTDGGTTWTPLVIGGSSSSGADFNIRFMIPQ